MKPIGVQSHVVGEWIDGNAREFESLNPARPSEVVAYGRTLDESNVAQAVDAAAAAYPAWRKVSVHARAAILVRAADLIEARKNDLAVELTREQGKILLDSTNEVQRAADLFRYYATLANHPTGTTFASLRATEHVWSMRQPLGVVSLITPWNIPITIPSWKIAPALLCGNTIVWKPSELVPLISVRLMEILCEAGLPPGVCNLVLADPSAAGPLLSHPAVRACSFTGSTAVGQHLIAEGARHGVKVQAEMGGVNSAIVLADADLDWAVQQVVASAMLQTGQRCTATARALVARPVFDRFLASVVDGANALVVGDGLVSSSNLGPAASADARDRVVAAIEAASAGGASNLTRHHTDESEGGYFVRPTVLSDVGAEDPIFLDEVFGPVLSVLPFDDLEEGLTLANAGKYGLAGAIFTSDIGTILTAVDEFDVGLLHINSETCGADPHVPFGGTKASGTSQREMGTVALDFFSETKTIYLRPSPAER